MKLKTIPRTYDNSGYRLRAGCLCYKDDKEKEVLLVSSSKKGWIVPAGGIDPGENAMDAAVREVHEEAGVLGDVGACVDVFRDEKRKTVTYIYSLVVRELVAPLEQKKRKWFSIDEAVHELGHRPVQQSYITRTMAHKPTPTSTTPAVVVGAGGKCCIGGGGELSVPKNCGHLLRDECRIQGYENVKKMEM